MATAVVSTKGQVVIPARVRAELGVAAGSRVEFVKTDAGWLLQSADIPVTALKGVLGKPNRPVSIDDMKRIIRRRGRP